MTRTHLNHCNLSLRIDFQKSKRDTDTIVEITLGSSDIVLHRKHLTEKFLGGSLSVGSSQSDDCQRFTIDKSH